MTEEEMEGPISFWGYKEQESNLILPEHDDDDEVTSMKVAGNFVYHTVWHLNRIMYKTMRTK